MQNDPRTPGTENKDDESGEKPVRRRQRWHGGGDGPLMDLVNLTGIFGPVLGGRSPAHPAPHLTPLH